MESLIEEFLMKEMKIPRLRVLIFTIGIFITGIILGELKVSKELQEQEKRKKQFLQEAVREYKSQKAFQFDENGNIFEVEIEKR